MFEICHICADEINGMSGWNSCGSTTHVLKMWVGSRPLTPRAVSAASAMVAVRLFHNHQQMFCLMPCGTETLAERTEKGRTGRMARLPPRQQQQVDAAPAEHNVNDGGNHANNGRY